MKKKEKQVPCTPGLVSLNSGTSIHSGDSFHIVKQHFKNRFSGMILIANMVVLDFLKREPFSMKKVLKQLLIA